ncbi:class I SAM-dependent methyltransferase [Sulfurirhabdus autotrophica]|uniref:Methyltransferase family protein n=1 Tax=Sulfurirhabdus autotrophica TaxID=1706046 RepID=A0A4R3YCS6_9PROT|nr:methyltransferase domain-containing protein [Sulfurirhabdus autotrophica]TCV90265.1 methyltransferase family protein [Sulfurirhabdus autotrophica]
MTPDTYDAWYLTPRGNWIGQTEYQLIRALLQAEPGSSIVDVGCGTGYFTRRFVRDGIRVTGLDPNQAMVDYAYLHRVADERYIRGDAVALPFSDRSFKYCSAITSLCFIKDQTLAVSEMVRVTESRIALGLLNRHSLLFQQKGKNGGSGAYKGAHWHSVSEVPQLFLGLPVTNLQIRSAIYLPGGNIMARSIEAIMYHRLPLGGFLIVTGDIIH